jgi:hypothetical protein
MKVLRAAAALALSVGLTGCADGDGPTRSPTATSTARTASPAPTASATPIPSRVVHTGSGPYVVGDAISIDWLMDADGADPRRVSPEIGQCVAWSPDSRYLLVSGRALYIVRPDGSGRLELRADGIDRSLGGIPDWR